METVLHERLDATLRLPPEDGRGFTSHLPMALQALHALGADGARLDAFAARYGRRFDGAALRVDEEFSALRARFDHQLAEQGREATLRRVLPELLPGLATAAFHGAIRTAHAIEAGHDGELAAALAYWSWRWRALPTPPLPAQRYDFEVWAAMLVEGSRGWRSESPSISGAMRAAAESPIYAELAAGPWPVPDLLRRLAGLALERYLVSGNFTVLHLVTGLRALRVLGGTDDALLSRAFVAAYLAARVVERPRMKVQTDWPEVIAAAMAQDDDHVIKLVHACREEFAVYGDPRYLEAAALAALRPSV